MCKTKQNISSQIHLVSQRFDKNIFWRNFVPFPFMKLHEKASKGFRNHFVILSLLLFMVLKSIGWNWKVCQKIVWLVAARKSNGLVYILISCFLPMKIYSIVNARYIYRFFCKKSYLLLFMILGLNEARVDSCVCRHSSAVHLVKKSGKVLSFCLIYHRFCQYLAP